jgi:hypothetical protein
MPTLNYPIRVPSDVLEALGEFTGHCWSDSLSLEPFICAAIRNHVRAAPAAQTQPTAASRAGHQWKQVFLPEGTRLRACFGGHNYFAQVEGGGNQIRRACNVAVALCKPTGQRQPQCVESPLALPSRECGALQSAAQPAARLTASASVTCVSPPCAKAAHTKAAHAKASQAPLADRLR